MSEVSNNQITYTDDEKYILELENSINELNKNKHFKDLLDYLLVKRRCSLSSLLFTEIKNRPEGDRSSIIEGLVSLANFERELSVISLQANSIREQAKERHNQKVAKLEEKNEPDEEKFKGGF